MPPPLKGNGSRRRGVVSSLAEASRQRPPDEQPLKAWARLRAASRTEEHKEEDADQRHSPTSSGPEVFALPEEGDAESGADSPSFAKSSLSKEEVANASKSAKSAKNTLITTIKATKRLSLLQQMRKEELKVGEAWNETFKDPVKRNDPEIIERFWTETKARLMKRFGTIHTAFRHIDSSGDGQISFLEFNDMLRLIHLPLDQRICRAMFEKASGGDRALSLEELKAMLMEKTIQKLQQVMSGFRSNQERIKRHTHLFLRYLAQADRTSLTRAVDRFQRKLTIPFCRDFWNMVRDHLTRTHSLSESDGRLDRFNFKMILHQAVGQRFMAYEVSFLLQIFDRVDARHHGEISLSDMITTLVLLSPDADPCGKLGLLFQVFDTDCDGCLLYEQILSMLRCICARRPIAEGTVAKTQADLAFQEELTAQDGQRIYECIFWHLQRTTKVISDIVSWREFWDAVHAQPEVLNALLPGTFRIRWAMGSPEEAEEELLPMEEPAVISSTGIIPIPGSFSGGGGSFAWGVESSGAGPGHSHSRLHSADHDHGHGHGHSHSHGHGHGSPHSHGHGHGSPHGFAENSAVTRRGALQRANPRHSGINMLNSPLHVPGAHGFERADSADRGPFMREDATTLFRRDVTARFQNSLRKSGNLRYAELAAVFSGVDTGEAAAAAENSDGGLTPSSRGSVQAGTSGQLPRPASQQTLRSRGPPSTDQRPASSAGRASRGFPASPAKGQEVSKGRGAAAHGDSPGTPPHQRGMSRARGSQSTGDLRQIASMELPTIGSTIGSQKWGAEAADRFRLYASVKNSRRSANEGGSAAAAGGGGSGSVGPSVGLIEGYAYKCQLCRSQHTLRAAVS